MESHDWRNCIFLDSLLPVIISVSTVMTSNTTGTSSGNTAKPAKIETVSMGTGMVAVVMELVVETGKQLQSQFAVLCPADHCETGPNHAILNSHAISFVFILLCAEALLPEHLHKILWS